MKKIGLISDTHGWLDDAVFRHFESCNEVWHAGDIGSVQVLSQLQAFKPVRAVWGNIDEPAIRALTVENDRFMCEQVDVWITHIGGRPGNYSTAVRALIHQNPPQLFICGHSHICLVTMDKTLGVLHMNPGAAGRQGFHKMRTLLRFVIDGKEIKQLEVIELGPK